MKSLLLNALLLIAGFSAQAQSSTPVANIDAGHEGSPISPYLYGQFVEHAGSLIYNSLWSEMLDDRKFYFPVMLKPDEDMSSTPRRQGFGGQAGFRIGKNRSLRSLNAG